MGQSLTPPTTPWRRSTAWWSATGTRRRALVAAATVLALAVLSGLGVRWATGGETGGAAAPPPSPETSTSSPTDRAAPQRGVGRPRRLVVPSLGIDAPVVPIEMDTEGVLTPPADVQTVGWWQRSAQPGAGRGQTLVTGHAMSQGDGAMDQIGELEPGDQVELHARREQVTYEATRAVTLTRDQVAEQAVRLFGQQRRDGRLVLVTCTDWDGDTWRKNVIVFADRVGVGRA